MKRRLSMINTGESSESNLMALMIRMQEIDDEDSDANMITFGMV